MAEIYMRMIKNKMTCLFYFLTHATESKKSLHDKMKTSLIANCKQREKIYKKRESTKKIRKNTKLGLQMTHQMLLANGEKK